MNTSQLIAEARANRPGEPAPSLDHVEQALRRLLNTLLSGLNYDARTDSGPATVCRYLAAILAEVEDVQRMRVN